MAYHPNIPTPTGVVQDELAQMRENFQHLAPLAPYIQAILDSRIVDHNLDVPNPPNGYYVRYESGIQECWGSGVIPTSQGWNFSSDWGGFYRTGDRVTFPAAFMGGSVPAVSLGWLDGQVAYRASWHTEFALNNTGFTPGAFAHATGSGDITFTWRAIGRWK